MRAKFYTLEEVAEAVGKANNNDGLRDALKLYLTPVVSAGFLFAKEIKETK